MQQVLVVEDDEDVIGDLTSHLQASGYTADTASNKDEAIEKLKDNQYALVTIDIMLGYEKNAGINIISFMNQQNINVPILVISGMDPTIYSDITLNMIGVWDFIAKPFDAPSLMTKINRLVKHSQTSDNKDDAKITYKDMVLDLAYPSQSTWKKKRLNLTLTQSRILSLLLENQGTPVSYNQFYKVIDTGHNTTNVRSHIKKIRELFRDIDPDFSDIQAVPSIGYMLVGQ
jgi:DNA-binding response OmpR family regulator